MTKKPKGVYVRLPLSVTVNIKGERAFTEALINGKSQRKANEASLLAMGTPVYGKNLGVVAFEHALSYEDGTKAVRFRDTITNPWGTPGRDFSAEYETAPRDLVYGDNAQALIAARDAEIARLREENDALKTLAKAGRDNPKYCATVVKGGEA